jgi:hypothetical protein
MAEMPASDAGPEPLVLFTPAIQTGSQVTVRRPGAGERGVWRVTGRVARTSPDDPAYDVTHTKTTYRTSPRSRSRHRDLGVLLRRD